MRCPDKEKSLYETGAGTAVWDKLILFSFRIDLALCVWLMPSWKRTFSQGRLTLTGDVVVGALTSLLPVREICVEVRGLLHLGVADGSHTHSEHRRVEQLPKFSHRCLTFLEQNHTSHCQLG